jgi:polysaccharide export outer membrane protein
MAYFAMTRFALRLIMPVLVGVMLIISTAWAAGDYKLGPGDIIKITVFDYPDLSTEERVSESGTVSFPLLGKLAVGGLSADEARNLIASDLEAQGFIKQAHVTVLVTQFVSRQVSVIGEVNKPGKYPLDKTSTIVDLLSMAGGVSSSGGDKAILIRPATEGGKETKTEIDLYALFQGGESKHLEVINGDIIYVPRALVFYVYGEVQRPGMIRLERNMTVTHAISAAGGLTPKGTENGIKLKRRDAHGDMQTLEDVGMEEQVKPDDILYVRESWF